MAGSTPNLDLYLPGGGSTGTWTPDETADIDPLNQNFQKIDTAVGDPDNQNRQWYGPAADIGTLPVSPKDGDSYQESDGNKILWKRVGGVWITNEGGAYLIRPASVANGAIASDGAIIPTNGTNGTTSPLGINGIFSSRFKRYRLEFQYRVSASSGSSLRLRAGGNDYITADYSYQTVIAAGASPGAGRSVNVAQLGVAGFASTDHWGHVDIFSPRTAGIPKAFQGLDGTGAVDHTTFSGMLANAGGLAYVADGLSFHITSNAAWDSSSDKCWFKVYGLA